MILRTPPGGTTYRIIELLMAVRILRRRGRLGHIQGVISMKRKSVVAAVSAVFAAASLSGCYVIPIDPRYPPAAGQPFVVAPGGTPVAVPAPQPVPTTLQARL